MRIGERKDTAIFPIASFTKMSNGICAISHISAFTKIIAITTMIGAITKSLAFSIKPVLREHLSQLEIHSEGWATNGNEIKDNPILKKLGLDTVRDIFASD